MRRALLSSAIGLLALCCARNPGAARPTYSGAPKAFKLLNETPEAETVTRQEKRTDLLVTVENGEPVPAVIAMGQTTAFSRQGGTVRLYGDEAGNAGWSVDNFVLLEVTDTQGRVVGRAAVGFQQGVTRGAEQLDSLGQMKFGFGPGEVDISHLLPADEPVTIKATALDVGGVGRVTDLYVILSAPEGAAGVQDEELRDR
ncbi:MAG: hypothetical protein HY901_31645 [Deltaproteobacteria bacterium]|nr:hypothetical protein [Deltaproteobacteria bacterium]